MCSSIFYIQLLSKAVEFVGDLPQCERLLVEVELVCSEDYFEKLNSQAYDLGAVMEEVQETMGGMEEKGNLSSIIPPPSKVLTRASLFIFYILNFMGVHIVPIFFCFLKFSI